jgi:SAM-dependent methyltransferase
MDVRMKTLESNSLAAMEFELNWQSAEARHRELYYAPHVNIWRDIFPAEVAREILGSRENETFTFAFKPGVVVPKFSAAKVLDLSPGQFSGPHVSGHKLAPQVGRFYPSGLLRDVAGVYPQALAPFRVIGLDEKRMQVDLNHPLSRQALELRIQVKSIRRSGMERGGRCTDWLEELTHNGPGMQARVKGIKTVFKNRHSFKRQDEDDDSRFYTAPRLVGHVDSQASSMLCHIYTGFLNRNDKVLDLMSSVQSHLPENYDLATTGLGLNKAELKKNPALNSHLVHDLNETGLLPFGNHTFDVVVCSLAIEYLTNPREIINEISRVLVPGGRVLISFSNRWFPPKVTQLWLEMHDFERMGLVLDYLLGNGRFAELCTFSARNWPRPADDRHAAKIATSDPIFVVAATKKPQ